MKHLITLLFIFGLGLQSLYRFGFNISETEVRYIHLLPDTYTNQNLAGMGHVGHVAIEQAGAGGSLPALAFGCGRFDPATRTITVAWEDGRLITYGPFDSFDPVQL